MRIGVGVSTAPDARKAAVQATARARDELAGTAPSLAVLLASRSHTDQALDVLGAVQDMVEPPALIGCVAQAVVAGRHEIEDEPAVAVWLPSGLPAETFQLEFVRTGSGGLLTGYRFDRTGHDLHLLLDFSATSWCRYDHRGIGECGLIGHPYAQSRCLSTAAARVGRAPARIRPDLC